MYLNRINNIRHLVALAVIGLLLIGLAQPALADLPPRTTPTPIPTEAFAPSAPGNWIELRVQFPSTWPWAKSPWNQVWTVVQWQDAAGNWYTVEGWQGTLDEIIKTEGVKAWWVSRSDWGKGPFRWVVYRTPGGAWLGTSQSFNLPGYDGATVKVEMMLSQ